MSEEKSFGTISAQLGAFLSRYYGRNIGQFWCCTPQEIYDQFRISALNENGVKAMDLDEMMQMKERYPDE